MCVCSTCFLNPLKMNRPLYFTKTMRIEYSGFFSEYNRDHVGLVARHAPSTGLKVGSVVDGASGPRANTGRHLSAVCRQKHFSPRLFRVENA